MKLKLKFRKDIPGSINMAPFEPGLITSIALGKDVRKQFYDIIKNSNNKKLS